MAAFENAKETQKGFSDEQLEAEKSRLLNEISALGVKMDEAMAASAEHDALLMAKKAELEAITKQIDGHYPLLEQHRSELGHVQDAIENAKNTVAENGDLDLANDEKKKELAGHQDAIAQLKTQADGLQATIDKSGNEIDDLTIKRDALKNECEAIIEAKGNAVKELEAKSAELSTDVSSLEARVKELAEEAGGHMAASHEHQAASMVAVEELNNTKDELNKVNTDIEKAKADEAVNSVARTADLDAREKAIQAREGDASLKESWLQKKKESLIAIKTEMELHLGRKIPVIIPPDENVV